MKKTPITLMISSICRMTNDALRLTFPIDPPMTTASVVTARNVMRKKSAAAIQKIGCRNWWRSSKRKISASMVLSRGRRVRRAAYAAAPARFRVEKYTSVSSVRTRSNPSAGRSSA